MVDYAVKVAAAEIVAMWAEMIAMVVVRVHERREPRHRIEGGSLELGRHLRGRAELAEGQQYPTGCFRVWEMRDWTGPVYGNEGVKAFRRVGSNNLDLARQPQT